MSQNNRNSFPYQLDWSSRKKTTCPSCNSKKRFTHYVYTESREIVHEDCGRCDREQQCGYHAKPKQFLSTDAIREISTVKIYRPVSKAQTSHLPMSLVSSSFKNHESNHFYQWLYAIVGGDLAAQAISNYYLGSSKRWEGACVFWLVDISGKVRTGKVMSYNAQTGKRNKSRNDWAHSILERSGKIKSFKLSQCYFGEHLLANNDKPVCIVESEKTAVVMSVLEPTSIWLATGGKNGLKWLRDGNSNCLKNRAVTLFPDKGCFKEWQEAARKFSILGISCLVSDYIELNEQLPNGADVLDSMGL